MKGDTRSLDYSSYNSRGQVPPAWKDKGNKDLRALAQAQGRWQHFGGQQLYIGVILGFVLG